MFFFMFCEFGLSYKNLLVLKILVGCSFASLPTIVTSGLILPFEYWKDDQFEISQEKIFRKAGPMWWSPQSGMQKKNWRVSRK
jgi:hypothetical protein